MGIQVETHTERKLTIRLQALPCDCWACGDNATGLNLGIPVYEDMVLPNDWPGEWFGVPACRACYERQGALTKPMQQRKFLER